jgi:hypothetical protein
LLEVVAIGRKNAEKDPDIGKACLSILTGEGVEPIKNTLVPPNIIFLRIFLSLFEGWGRRGRTACRVERIQIVED